MSLEGSYSFKDLTGFIEEIPAHHSMQSFESIKSLAIDYQARKFPRTKDSRDSVAQIKNLAKEYKHEQISSLQSQQLRILTPGQLRIHIFRANKDARIEDVRAGVVAFREVPLPRIPQLPREYGFKGGAARIALAAILGKNVKNRKPRDWDIIRVGGGSNPRDNELARRYMPDDYKHGFGVEIVNDMRSYLHTRDLTINQVAIFEGQVICTYSAIEDTLNGVLRPTEYVRRKNDTVDAKITMKMLRMIAEAKLEGFELSLAETTHNPAVTPFEIALHLERILQRGTRAARYYLELCMSLGYLKDEDGKAPIGDIIAKLKKLLNRSKPQSKVAPVRGGIKKRR